MEIQGLADCVLNGCVILTPSKSPLQVACMQEKRVSVAALESEGRVGLLSFLRERRMTKRKCASQMLPPLEHSP